jgi:signal transduction histidine kinase
MPRLSRAFIAVMALIAGWSLCEILFMYASSLQTKTLIDAYSYIFISLLPVAWVHFASLFSGREGIMGSRYSPLLFVIPLLTILFAFTNGHHGLIWEEMRLVLTESGRMVERIYGPWFWAHTAYAYLLVLSGIYFVSSGLGESPPHYRHHYYLVLVGIIVPISFNILYIAMGSPFNGVDYTPAFFFVTMIVMAYAVFSSRFLDIMPLALRRVFGVLSDALVVLDTKGRVIDMNNAAEHLFSTSSSVSVGVPYDELGKLPSISDMLKSDAVPCYYEASTEMGSQVYSCAAHAIVEKGVVEGYIMSLRDITPEIRAKKTLERLNTHLMVYNKMVRHDITNSIMAAQGYVSLIDADGSELQTRALSALQRGMDLIKMFNKLEGVISSEHGYQPLYLNHFITTIASTFPELSITVEGDGTAEANEALGFIFNNLFHNALVHGKSSKVDVTITQEDDRCYIDVMDNGPGIPPEMEKKIFHDGTSYGVTKGSGLGLHISRWIVREMGGDIYLRPDADKEGAHFRIEVPRNHPS